MAVCRFYFLLCVVLVYVRAYPAAQGTTSNDCTTVDTPAAEDINDEPNPEEEDQDAAEYIFKQESSDKEVPAGEEIKKESEGDEKSSDCEDSTSDQDEAYVEYHYYDTKEYTNENEESNGNDNAAPESEYPDEYGSGNEESVADDPSSAVESNDGDNMESVDSRAEEVNDDDTLVVLSDSYFECYELKAVSTYTGSEKTICQILSDNNDEVLDKGCVTYEPPNPEITDEEVFETQKEIQGEKYFCQEISHPTKGPLQRLCVTDSNWYYTDRQELIDEQNPESSDK